MNQEAVIHDEHQFSYQLAQRNTSEYNKDLHDYNGKQQEHSQNLILSYAWNDYCTLSSNIGFSWNTIYTGAWSSETLYNAGLNWLYKNYGQGERELSCGVAYEGRNNEKSLQFINTIIYPWKWLNTNHRMSITLPLGQKKISRALFDTNLIFPKLWGITPSVNYQYNLGGEGRSKEHRESFTCNLQYDLNPNSAIYLKGKMDRSSTDQYLAMGVFTGIEIKF